MRNILKPLCQPSTENMFSLKGLNGTCPYLVESYFLIHILPHIDCCAIIWGSSPHTQNLLLAQKSATHMILDIKDIYHHSKDMFVSLKWMPIHD